MALTVARIPLPSFRVPQMAYFRNSAVNRVNLHTAIGTIAQGAGGIFFVVFMIKAGLSVPAAFATQAAILAGRFAIRPVILPLAKRFGMKPLLIVGSLGVAAIYPLIPRVHDVGWNLAELCLVASIADVLYWPNYHAYYASVGDPEHRGHQVSLRESVNAVIGVIAPILGGWALATAGGTTTFAIVGLVQACATIPLLGAPNVRVAPDAPGAFKAAKLGVLLFVADGWFVAAYYFFWQVGLFTTLGSNFRAYGGAMALAALLGAAFSLLLGRHIDAGGGRRAALIAYGLAIAVVVLRSLSLGNPVLAVLANAPGALVVALVVPAMMSAVYNEAQASPCPLRFHMVSEAAWDIGGGAGCVAGALLTASGQPLTWAILLAVPAAAFSMGVLLRHYGGLRAPEARAA